jgi:hypothetical protein
MLHIPAFCLVVMVPCILVCLLSTPCSWIHLSKLASLQSKPVLIVIVDYFHFQCVPVLQYTSRAAQLYRQQLEKEGAKYT